VQALGRVLAERLMDLFGHVSQPDWPWFEDYVTYWMSETSRFHAGTRSGPTATRSTCITARRIRASRSRSGVLAIYFSGSTNMEVASATSSVKQLAEQ
jgi:hypothetical protein